MIRSIFASSCSVWGLLLLSLSSSNHNGVLVASSLMEEAIVDTSGDATTLKSPPNDDSDSDDENDDSSAIFQYFQKVAGNRVDQSLALGQATMEWIADTEKCPGGFVHPALFLQHINQDPSLPIGMFTHQALSKDTIVLSIPASCTIDSGESQSEDYCDTARNLQKHLLLSQTKEGMNQSDFAPYLRYLLETQPYGLLPATWSKSGQDLLSEMLEGSHLPLPPFDPKGWHWLDYCDIAEEEEYAFQLVRQRSWDDILIPLYDLLNHRNGKYRNTYCDKVQGADVIHVKVLKDIPAGGELYNSYDIYPGSGDLHEWYGTPEILRDFGFVEQYPQRWIFQDEFNSQFGGQIGLSFDIDQVSDDSTDGFHYEVTWIREKPSKADLMFARTALKELKEFGERRLQPKHRQETSSIPDYEWNMIVEYHSSYLTALEQAILEAEYDALRIEPASIGHDHTYTCNSDETHAMPTYETVDEVRSHYQHMSFDREPDTGDVCFWILPYVQMCGNYQPHHHEVSVHYSARYVDQVKRVAFVGGGDSMLLHEILKYPDIEKVVGLELDQQVTRYNYKHLGMQPHYDDERVEWWYGDATKSALMLPKDYFGSFDLVLMDLSDTAMDLAVNDDLDVFGAFALLLNKGGVIVKNEEFLEHFSRVFDYTVQIHYYDVPIICSQSFILGSFDTDLLYREPKDHGVTDTLFMQHRPDVQSRFGIWHDYRKNVTRKNANCNKETVVPDQQVSSPGVLMVVEAEQSEALDSFKSITAVKDAVSTALGKAGLSVVDTVVAGTAVGGKVESEQEAESFTIVMKEGYVSVRVFFNIKYCAFDIHLWSSFDKHDQAKKALLNAVGSGRKDKSVTSFRVVAGGMFGVKTWKQDESKRGPAYNRECQEEEELSRGPLNEIKALTDVTMEILQLREHSSDITVAVICGKEDEPCDSFDIVSKAAKVSKAVPFRTCSDIDDGVDAMQACFELTKKKFKEQENKFGAIVVDPKASKSMGQVVHKVFTTAKSVSELLTANVLVMAHSMDATETWRRAFLDRFRRDVFEEDPVFRAEVIFNSSDTSMEMGFVSTGDKGFVEKIYESLPILEQKTGMVSDVRTIEGGKFMYQEDFEPSLTFDMSDYDRKPGLAQWKSQRPVALQTVFQLELQGSNSLIESGDYVEVLEMQDMQWYIGQVEEVRVDEVLSVRFFDGEIGLFPQTIARRVNEGDRVEVWVEEEELWTSGTLVEFAEEEYATVRFDDGEAEGQVFIGTLRLIVSELSSTPPEPLSPKDIENAISYALITTDFEGSAKADVKLFEGLGDGSLFTAYFSGGSAVVLWDGRAHIDINLFTFAEDSNAANLLVRNFREKLPYLKTMLRDEQPRGYGRVVNYARDMNAFSGRTPHWANGFE